MTRISKASAVVFVSASVLLTSVAQLLFKLGVTTRAPALESGATFVVFVSSLLYSINPVIISIGILLYAVSMLLWVFALTRFPVSLAYPMLSLSYVIVYLAATLRPEFGELGSTQKLVGVAFVVAGVSILSFGRRR